MISGRTGKFERATNETKIDLMIQIDGKGECEIDTGIGFLDHLLSAFSRHGMFDMTLKCRGDLETGPHHTVEDTGYSLGCAFRDALGDMKGIGRAGYFVFPMDEALAVVALDISGRPFSRFEARFKRRFCGDLDCDTLEDFFSGFSRGLMASVSVVMPYGASDHHKAESIFKAFGKAMKMACDMDRRYADYIPSTKGVID